MLARTLASLSLLAAAQPALANIDIQFDFSYDTSNFFSSNPDSVATLNAAASVFETRFADNLTAITSSGPNHFSTVFFNPSTPGADVTLSNQSVATDVIRIYAGAATWAARPWESAVRAATTAPASAVSATPTRNAGRAKR